jgi:membrane protein insertase Oxa1/YidC/SpoIIIJ
MEKYAGYSIQLHSNINKTQVPQGLLMYWTIQNVTKIWQQVTENDIFSVTGYLEPTQRNQKPITNKFKKRQRQVLHET